MCLACTHISTHVHRYAVIQTATDVIARTRQCSKPALHRASVPWCDLHATPCHVPCWSASAIVRKSRAWSRTSAGLPGSSGSAWPSFSILTPHWPVLASSPAPAPLSRFGGIRTERGTFSEGPWFSLEKTTNRKTHSRRGHTAFNKDGEEGAAGLWRGLGRAAGTPVARLILNGRSAQCGAGRTWRSEAGPGCSWLSQSQKVAKSQKSLNA